MIRRERSLPPTLVSDNEGRNYGLRASHSPAVGSVAARDCTAVIFHVMSKVEKIL